MQLIVNLINSYFYNDTVITLMVTFSDLDLKYLRAEFSISQNHISKVQSELKRTGSFECIDSDVGKNSYNHNPSGSFFQNDFNGLID